MNSRALRATRASSDTLEGILSYYQRSFLSKLHIDSLGAQDVLMEAFGITAEMKAGLLNTGGGVMLFLREDSLDSALIRMRKAGWRVLQGGGVVCLLEHTTEDLRVSLERNNDVWRVAQMG